MCPILSSAKRTASAWPACCGWMNARWSAPGPRQPAPNGALLVQPNPVLPPPPQHWPAQGSAPELEAHALRLLWRQPDALYMLDRALQQAGLNPFNPSDFDQFEHQLLARLVQQALAQDSQEWHQYITENIPDTFQEFVDQLKAPMQFGEPTSEQLLKTWSAPLSHCDWCV
jgi:hypothetical protein